MKHIVALTASFLFISTFGVAELRAQGPVKELRVTAQSMNALPDGTILAQGEVVVHGEGVTVRADELSYDPGSDTLLLKGNVVMKEDSGGAFTGDALALDLADLTGGIKSGEVIIVPNGFRVRGEDIIRTGPEEYSIRKGVFTSCPGDCPDWSFTANRIKVRQEGYLEARHAAFRILGVPVFYTPYLLYPVKTKRQSGLLFPELSFSDETGLESRWPIFVTLGPYADATISPRSFSRDGLGLDLESRYRLDWAGGGQVEGFGITGKDTERWYLRARHSMAITPDLWLRARWYDAGDPAAPSLFADDFEDRYPGAVLRHASIEGDHGYVGFNIQTSSLLTDGSLARSGLPGTDLKRDTALVRFGPGGGDLWRVGIIGEVTGFEGDESRDRVVPAFDLRIPGPRPFVGNVRARGIIVTGGTGSDEEESYIASMGEKFSIQSEGGWGKHRVDFSLTASAAQGAAFGGSTPRDSKDVIEERKLLDARLFSLLDAAPFRWELTAGAWHDSELDQSLSYGLTRFSWRNLFLNASRNRDAEYGLVLPSMGVSEELIEGWQAEIGYETGDLFFAVGKDSAKGSPDILKSRGHFTLAGVRFSGKALYDMDAGTVADETAGIQILGRCWTVEIERSRTPDRTDWSVQLGLGL